MQQSWFPQSCYLLCLRRWQIGKVSAWVNQHSDSGSKLQLVLQRRLHHEYVIEVGRKTGEAFEHKMNRNRLIDLPGWFDVRFQLYSFCFFFLSLKKTNVLLVSACATNRIWSYHTHTHKYIRVIFVIVSFKNHLFYVELGYDSFTSNTRNHALYNVICVAYYKPFKWF